MIRHNAKRLAIGALSIAALTGACDSGTEPPTPVTLSMTFDIGAAIFSGTSHDAIHLRLTHPSGAVALDTVAAVSGALALPNLEVPLEDDQETLSAEVEFRKGSQALYTGEGTVEVTAGASVRGTIQMAPVVGAVAIDGPLPVFEAIGDEIVLSGTALFATGEEVPGVTLAWTSADTTVARVVGSDRLVSTGEGVTTVTGSVGNVSEGIEARVEAVVMQVELAPGELLVPIGFDVPLEATALDANGNPLVREIQWATLDVGIAEVSEDGLVTGVGLGSTTVTATAGDVLASADVEVTPAPPIVADPQAVDPGTRSVTVSTSVTPNGAPTTVGMQWNTTEAPDVVHIVPLGDVGDGLEAVEVSALVSQLQTSSTIEVRVMAMNDFGADTSAVVSFTTADPTGGFVDGTLVAEGEPVAGAVVQLDGQASDTTDALGRYAFDDVELGAHSVAITGIPMGVVFGQTQATGQVTEVGQILILDFDGTFLRNSGISGLVQASGLPVPGVRVSIDGPDQRVTTTSADGAYVFSNIRAGTYAVSISEYDDGVLKFESTTTQVTVGFGETESAAFEGVDTDILVIEVFVYIGREGDRTGLYPVPGAQMGAFATQSLANANGPALGSGHTDGNGRAVVRMRKRDDDGDGMVWVGVQSLPGANLQVQADRVQGLSFSPSQTLITAPDTVDVINGTALIRWSLRTIQTGASDSGLYLHTWATDAYADTSGAAVGGSASSHGNVTVSVTRPANQLPQTLYFRANSNQPLTAGNRWTQVPEPSGRGGRAGRYLTYVHDGLGPANAPVDIGTIWVTYEEMSFWTKVHHEVDNTRTDPVSSPGDDLASATSITIQLRRGDNTIDSRQITSLGGIQAFDNQNSFQTYTMRATSSDPTITFVSPSTIPVGGGGGGTVGIAGPQGGYRHSVRVCPLAPDTIINKCSGFAYKFNNTSISGSINGAGAGVTVRITRCRPPQNSGTSCNVSDGFTQTTNTNGSGAYSFNNLLEGTYEVRPQGNGFSPASRVVLTRGKGGATSANFSN